MRLAAFCERLDERLDTADYADVDASPNGLQIGPEGDREVERVAFTVDAAVATAEAALDADADVLVAHHGVIWGGLDRVTGKAYRRVAPFVEEGLALYVSHLPLDGHQELGNAAGLGDLLDLADRQPFGEMGPVHVGQRGTLVDPLAPTALADRLREQLDTGAGDVRLLDFGPDRIEDVAIVTGSGTDWLDEAVAVDADVLITGEGKQKVYHEAREAGLNVVLAGHYATETVGVRNLASLAADWDLETTIVEHPTGI